MGEKGQQTRARILDVSQRLILRNGFSGTAIDEIVYEAEITKGGFFYHFKNRGELARELLLRYLEDDDRILTELAERAESLVDDPLQQLIVFLKLYSEVIENMEDVHPGCLVASYTYESNQFDDEIGRLTREGVESWKRHFLGHLDKVSELYETDADPGDLADMLNVILEGGIVLSKIEGSNRILSKQILMFRDYVKTLFSPKSA